jgi:ceramide glucosyltransferase
MNWLWSLPGGAAAVYWAIVCVAVWRHLRRRDPAPSAAEPVSILKPVRGHDPRFAEAIRSHARQAYAAPYEILFGVADINDPAAAEIRTFQSEYPDLPIRLIHSTTPAANGKVGVLIDLAREARYPVWVVNDSDISVPPEYLNTVTAPLADPSIGVVTCPYRASASGFAGRFEALGVATEFAPSVFTARALGVIEFAMGSTMAFRAASFKAAGGFEALADFLADDYQLGKMFASRGLGVHLSRLAVETRLGGGWRDVWAHQIRWSRTMRVSKPRGYAGYVVTHAVPLAAISAVGGAWPMAVAALTLRVIGGVLAAAAIGDRASIARVWLIPFRDLFGFAVWLAGLGGSTVEWRGLRYRLSSDGRMHPLR